MDYVVIPEVELMSVGIAWDGRMTFRFEHLADAAKAANEDPHIQLPRIKLGHEDPRFNTEEEREHDHDPFHVFDGEPALGSVENLQLTNGGSILVGDLLLIPWLAEIAPIAYPSRSIEGSWIDGRWEVVTPGGKKYSFVITALALLGIFRPAVENIEDLETFVTEGDGVQFVEGFAP